MSDEPRIITILVESDGRLTAIVGEYHGSVLPVLSRLKVVDPAMDPAALLLELLEAAYFAGAIADERGPRFYRESNGVVYHHPK